MPYHHSPAQLGHQSPDVESRLLLLVMCPVQQVYSPLELLLFIAGCCTIADSFVPQLISVPKATVTHVVRVVLSVSFVAGASTVVYNLKSRFCKEQAWQVGHGTGARAGVFSTAAHVCCLSCCF